MPDKPKLTKAQLAVLRRMLTMTLNYSEELHRAWLQPGGTDISVRVPTVIALWAKGMIEHRSGSIYLPVLGLTDRARQYLKEQDANSVLSD